MGWMVDRRRLLFFLSIVGPGIITANVDNDAGGITTYSLAGAHYGYGLLWSLIPITVLLIMVQEMVARLGVVTGKGLSDLIREEFGVKTTFLVLLALLLTNLGNIMAEFAGLAASLEILGVNRYIAVPAGGFLVWFLVIVSWKRFFWWPARSICRMSSPVLWPIRPGVGSLRKWSIPRYNWTVPM
jgi:NRAMP (natural resistance-associated macrophage protein)-like metal ion transporter